MKLKIACLVFSLACFSLALARADEAKPKTSLKAIELLSGFGHSNLEEKGSYNFVPVFLDFDFDLQPLLKKVGVNYPGRVEFVEEPAIFFVYHPDSNVEIANNFLLKIGIVPQAWKLQPYFKGGVGLVYMTQHVHEQGTQFNFNEYIGAGFHYFFKKNLALTAEYRYRHLSNCDTGKPNSGVEAQMGVAGLSYYF
jgi:hypothetical protein